MRVQYFNLKRNQSGLSWWCEWCVCQGITSRQDPRWKMLCREEILMFRFLPYLPLVWYGGKECSSLHDLKALVMTWENVYVWECWCFISPPLSFLVFQDGWSQDTEERVTAEAAASGIGCPMGNVFQGLGVTEVLSLMYPESVRIKDAELFFHRLFSLEFQRWWSSLKTNKCDNLSPYMQTWSQVFGKCYGGTYENTEFLCGNCRKIFWVLFTSSPKTWSKT